MAEMTKVAMQLVTNAEAVGWTARASAVTGTWKGREHDSVVVWLGRGDDRLVAQWLDGKATSAYAWTAGARITPSKVTFRDLKARAKGV